MKSGAASLLAEAAAVLEGRRTDPAARQADQLHVGVDLGTATMVLLVLDGSGHPISGRWQPAQVVRDGLVVDYIGAVDRLKAMKAEVEEELQQPLAVARSGFPPGVPVAERQAIAHVLEGAGLDCPSLIDEPSAANEVLGLTEGALVDVGGGTTGIAIIQDGEVVYTADEATGGTHFNLVIAGALDVEYERAEQMKESPDEQPRLLGVVRPVIEKIGTIVNRHAEGWPVPSITLVGGACAFPGIAEIVQEVTDLPTTVAPHTQWVTPLGISLAAANATGEVLLQQSTDGSIA